MSANAARLPAELTIAARADEFRRASAWLADAGRERDVPVAQIERLDVCLNEVLANIVAHGGAAALAAPIRLRLAACDDAGAREARLTISDAGVAFDPLAHCPKPRPASLAEAEPGGLGVLMLRIFADTFGYCHDEGRNHLTLGVRWTPSPR